MLQAIRSKATSFIVKMLFGLLIVTFGIWGIGDIFRVGSTSTTVATVGDREITADQVNQQVQQQLQRLRSVFGNDLDAEQAKKLGVVDQALDGLVSSTLIELEINRLGLAIGDQAVRDAILANPAFRGQNGQFDRNLYDQVLAANNLSDARFEAMERSDLLKQQLSTALGAGITPPKELVDALYRTRAEHRVADVATIPASAAGQIPAPTEQQIADFYKAHSDLFQAPERRSFKVALLDLDQVASQITVSDADVQQQFDQHPDEFRTPEERHIEQMLLPDEATAKTAETQLAAGKDFAGVAKDVAKEDDPKALDLGLVKRDDLPPELADAAFTLQQGQVSAPIKSAFGWHILKVTEVKPAAQQSLADVKDKLRRQIARDRAGDKLADLANNIDDAIAGGASFDDVVQKFGLKTVTATDLGSDGKTIDGKAADLPEASDAILKTAFSTDNGQTSPLEDRGDSGNYLVQVTKVTPAETRPLAEVHDAAATAWQQDAQRQALQKVADDLVHEVEAGRSLKDAAAAKNFTVTTTPPLPRTGGKTAVPPSLVAQIFQAKQGAAVTEDTQDGEMVAQVMAIEPADPAANPGAVDQLSQELGQVMQGDVLSEYDRSLRQEFPVKTNQEKLDQLL